MMASDYVLENKWMFMVGNMPNGINLAFFECWKSQYLIRGNEVTYRKWNYFPDLNRIYIFLFATNQHFEVITHPIIMADKISNEWKTNVQQSRKP